MASTPGAVYTGLAIGNNGSGNFLYAADFHGDKIDVFDGTYTPTTLAGSFVDPEIPEDYAPFNIQNLGGKLYVTYARPQETGDALVRGGNGYVSVFDTSGNFVNRLISEDRLKSPWGVVLAPADFGEFSGALIVGNSGNGHINAFDAASGAFLGRLRDAAGEPIQIDGLFGLHFGNGTVSGDRNALYFAAAPDKHRHGLFGSLRVAADAPAAEATGAESPVIAAAPMAVPGDAPQSEIQVVSPKAPDRSSRGSAALAPSLAALAVMPSPLAWPLGDLDLPSQADDGEGLSALDSLFAADFELADELFG
jgi:hypothetical protein